VCAWSGENDGLGGRAGDGDLAADDRHIMQLRALAGITLPRLEGGEQGLWRQGGRTHLDPGHEGGRWNGIYEEPRRVLRKCASSAA